MDRVSLVLVILGALNWACVGLFRFDAIAFAFGGPGVVASRIIYTIVGLAGIWCISMLFRKNDRRAEE